MAGYNLDDSSKNMYKDMEEPNILYNSMIIPENLSNVNLTKLAAIIIPRYLRSVEVCLMTINIDYDQWMEYFRVFKELATKCIIKPGVIIKYARILISSNPICIRNDQDEKVELAKQTLNEMIEIIKENQRKVR